MALKKHSQSKKTSLKRPCQSSGQPKSDLKNMFAQGGKADAPSLKDQLDFFRSMLDRVGDDIMILDRESRIIFVNASMVKALGYAQRNILGRPVTEFMQEKTSVKQWQELYFMQAKKTGKPLSYTVNRVIKGGKVRTIDVTATYMTYGPGEYLLVVGRDVSKRVAFQKKLKQSEDRYRLLSEQAAEGILVVDTKGVIVFANKAACDIFQVALPKVIGTPFGNYIGKSSLPKVLKCFDKVKSGQSSICNDTDIINRRGKIIPSELMGTPIFADKKVVQAHVIFRNMSQRREMENLLRESEKMKALQHFVAGMTREIQQPLKGLLDRSQSLVDKYQDRQFEYIGYREFEDIMKTLRTMSDQVKYCYDTTDRIISLNRKKVRLVDQRCSANQVIKESVGLLKHSLEAADISLKLKLSSRLPSIAIGPLDFSQALSNVLTNAIQSLPSGGKIRIATTYQKAIDSVRIDCHDDGMGIPKEVLDRVFEPFFTTKPRGLEKNSGLGLSIVYSIIKNHQGQVRIKSDLHKGTLVTILLPAYRTKKKAKQS